MKLIDVHRQFNTDDKCLDYLEAMRWPSGVAHIKLSDVPVREAKVSGLEAERFLIESNKQREKTKTQRLREYKRLKEIETELAAERKKSAQLKTKSQVLENQDRANLPERSNGRARSKAAATVGLKEKTAEKGLAVLNKAESGGLTAVEALKSIDKNELSVDRAYLVALTRAFRGDTITDSQMHLSRDKEKRVNGARNATDPRI